MVTNQVIPLCVICGTNLVPNRHQATLAAGRVVCSRACNGALKSLRAKERAQGPEFQKNCKICGKQFTRRKKTGRAGFESVSAFKKRKFCSPKCAAQVWVKNDNEMSHNGLAWRAANLVMFHQIPQICNRCGAKGSESKRLDIHHRDHVRTNNTIENLEVLCKKCHIRHHWDQIRPKMNRNQPCCVEGCESLRFHLVIFCSIHYRRYQAYGDPRIQFQHGGSPTGGRRQIAGPAVEPKYFPTRTNRTFWQENQHNKGTLTWCGKKILVDRLTFSDAMNS